MDTVKVKFHHEDPGNCKTTFKEAGKGSYYNRIDGNGGWYTVYPSQGYWENSSRVKDETIFEVLDFDGHVIFAESNGNLGAFQSIRQRSREAASQLTLPLQTHEAWRDWLLPGMEAHGFTEKDDWLYIQSEIVTFKPLLEYFHLGLTFWVMIDEMEHRICKKKWCEVYVKNITHGCRGHICGYLFHEK